MVVSALLSVFTSAWVFAAAPFTVTLKSVGYSARSDGEQVTVSRVEQGSVADRAGLEPGMILVRISEPPRGFTSRTPLAQLKEADLLDALTPQPAEYLELKVRAEGAMKRSRSRVILQSPEPLPDNPFPTVPLPPEQMARLTPRQLSLYFARLAVAGSEARNRPRLQVSQETTAHVVKGRLAGVDGGGFTPLWIHPSLVLDADCHGPLQEVALRGGEGGPSRTLKPDSMGRTQERFTVDLPLWSTREVIQGCSKEGPVFERRLHASLSCQGKPTLEQDIPVKLTVRCADAPPRGFVARRLLLFLDEPTAFLVGDQASVQGEVDFDKILPRPAEAALVELDAAGAVSRRILAIPMDSKTRPKAQAPLDTTNARTVRLAIEARFADGSTWIGEPQTREIRTPAQVEALNQRVTEHRAKLDAFEKRFAAQFDDPCQNLSATMTWLRAQDELEYASAEDDGHSFSYNVKGGLAPVIFNCHRWE
ncbi:hypothetical protein JGU66_00285 [Myxococcaceae bacterium JPH2]|nr:hypothetical protein [Myxococcaceae bacterium JPH2]